MPRRWSSSGLMRTKRARRVSSQAAEEGPGSGSEAEQDFRVDAKPAGLAQKQQWTANPRLPSAPRQGCWTVTGQPQENHRKVPSVTSCRRVCWPHLRKTWSGEVFRELAWSLFTEGRTELQTAAALLCQESRPPRSVHGGQCCQQGRGADSGTDSKGQLPSRA